MPGRNSDSGRYAIIWLATAFVVVIGAGASAFVVFAATARGTLQERESSFMVWGFCVSGIVLALIVMNLKWDRPLHTLKTWLSIQERGNPADEYSVARRSIEAREKYGTNKPPSVDSVRDASEHIGTWVPSSAQSNPSKKPRGDRK